MKNRTGKDETSILGDIDPEPKRSPDTGDLADDIVGDAEPSERSMTGGSQEDRTKHSGSRDVTEGTTGGTGTEVGGTRNLRTGTGSTGTDIGNRPE